MSPLLQHPQRGVVVKEPADGRREIKSFVKDAMTFVFIRRRISIDMQCSKRVRGEHSKPCGC